MYKKDNITLFNKDFREIFSKLPDNYANLIITDPPYKTTKRGISKKTTTGGIVRNELGKQGKMFEHNDIKIKDFMPELYRILKEDSHCYVMTNNVNLHEMLDVARECGFHFIKPIVWEKGNKIMGQTYMSCFEMILFFRKGKHKKINNCGTPDILKVPNIKLKDENGENLHPTEKPVDLMKTLVENSSNEGDLVVDPFSGIGAVALACKETNRRFGGCEIDKKYFDTAVLRLEGVI